MKGPSSHLSWSELACVNRLGRRFDLYSPGEVIADYPNDWRGSRVINLAATFEDIRQFTGNEPISVNSAYRTSAYNQAVGGAKLSQHVLGRALDIRHPKLTPFELFHGIRRLHAAGNLPLLGGIGLYRGFVHIDVRWSERGRLAVWYGSGEGA